MKTPVIASDWTRIVEYPDNHLNDFCMFRDLAGTWHCTGIMGTGTWESEQSLFHCSCRELLGAYEIHPPLLTEVPATGSGGNTAPQKHAPFVVEKAGVYHLFYRRPPGTILRVKSADPSKWTGLGEVVFERNDARDICIVEIEGIYHIYYCQLELYAGENRSCIVLRRSRDLEDWGEPEVVYVDMMQTAVHSYLESPYVVQRPQGFYLFIRHRLLEEKCTTVVLFSERPDRFPTGERPWFHELDFVHAPEIVKHEGSHYIARVSGVKHASRCAPVEGGWVEIARLEFL